MLELKWTEVLPDQSLESGVKLLTELGWHLRVREVEGALFVNSGHTTLLKTSSREVVDALLFGMAISFATLPPRALEEVRRFVKESCE
jgi:hypothetical protein